VAAQVAGRNATYASYRLVRASRKRHRGHSLPQPAALDVVNG